MSIRERYLKMPKICVCLDVDKKDLFERRLLIIWEKKMNNHLSDSRGD